MARITRHPLYRYNVTPDFSVMLRDPITFFHECFGFLKDIPLPRDHHETMTFCVAGDIQSGKTTAIEYFAYLCKESWGDLIDFYKADDIYSTIEFVKRSDKFAHFICIDDAVRPGLDSRRSTSSQNVSGSQKFLIMRQLFREGILKRGFVILAFASQMFTAIEKRVRKHFSFILFKTYDEGCEKLIPEEELIDFLKLLKDKSSRVKDARYRALGICVSMDGLYTPMRIPFDFPRVKFQEMKIDSLYTVQLKNAINYISNLNILKMKMDLAKAYLDEYLDELKKETMFIEIGKQSYNEIIRRAKLKKIKKQRGDNIIELIKDFNKKHKLTPVGEYEYKFTSSNLRKFNQEYNTNFKTTYQLHKTLLRNKAIIDLIDYRTVSNPLKGNKAEGGIAFNHKIFEEEE